ncbi:class B sortase [Ruminococcus flavefaciens]|uniref:class B sortase n=1 Tax=Ruminococcus flavefaciens TaxID=1265 RepID=UPI0006881C9B|nr:class B sortase [Ruminococcus flavefaciens]
MKKGILITILLLLLFSGAYAVYRYRQEVYLPEKRMTSALDKQEKLFDRVRPDVENIPVATAADSPDMQPVTGSETVTEAAVPSPVEEVRKVCSDAVGWLYVPDTGIDYPVVQGEDNSFYLDHGLDRESDPFGLPFLDCRCAGDFSGYTSIIYAHNFEGMLMFAPVGLYRDSSYMDSHRQGFLVTDKGRQEIEFFAYLTVPSDSPIYNTVFITDKDRREYAELLLHTAAYHSSVTAEELSAKNLVLLSTCTFEYDEARGVLAGFFK